jgi:hypothetical protein
MNACETTSKSEPDEISIKRAKSVFELRDDPSAMFDEIETAARRIWLVRPKRSSAATVAMLVVTASILWLQFRVVIRWRGRFVPAP